MYFLRGSLPWQGLKVCQVHGSVPISVKESVLFYLENLHQYKHLSTCHMTADSSQGPVLQVTHTSFLSYFVSCLCLFTVHCPVEAKYNIKIFVSYLFLFWITCRLTLWKNDTRKLETQNEILPLRSSVRTFQVYWLYMWLLAVISTFFHVKCFATTHCMMWIILYRFKIHSCLFLWFCFFVSFRGDGHLPAICETTRLFWKARLWISEDSVHWTVWEKRIHLWLHLRLGWQADSKYRMSTITFLS